MKYLLQFLRLNYERSKNHKQWILTSVFAALLLIPSNVQAVSFGSNLIVNGDAESGQGAPNAGTVLPVPDWTTVGNFTALSYLAGQGAPDLSSPGPANRGVNFFYGGPANASSSATQLLDLSSSAVAIDTGTIDFLLSGFLGGFIGQGDNAVLTAAFRDAANSVLGTASIGPVTAADRSDITGLLERSTIGDLPSGTRNVLLTLQMTRLNGMTNDGFADNLSFSVNTQSVPEPSTLLLLVSGVVGLLGYRRLNQ